jgi:hypothetical protein
MRIQGFQLAPSTFSDRIGQCSRARWASISSMGRPAARRSATKLRNSGASALVDEIGIIPPEARISKSSSPRAGYPRAADPPVPSSIWIPALRVCSHWNPGLRAEAPQAGASPSISRTRKPLSARK